MSREIEWANKQMLRRFVEQVWNQGDLDAADKYFFPDMVDYGREPIQGLDAFKELIRIFRVAAPDIRWQVDDLVAEGDRVVLRWTATGTHTGEYQGIPPSGKQIRVSGFGMNRIVDGRTIEHWRSFDELGMLQQMGVIPPMKQA
jgi:steroid delta-isomerase-like uncharacterized protein